MSKKNLNKLKVTVLLSVLFSSLSGCKEKVERGKSVTVEKLPNIIYVLADDLGLSLIHI